MGAKQSKQEQRLAKALAKQAAKAAAEVAVATEASLEEAAAEAGDPMEPGEAAALLAMADAEAAAEGVEEQLAPAQEAVADKAEEQPQEQPQAPAVKGPILHVKKGLALRGGRGEWYKLLCKYDGQPVAAYVAEGKANPASHYTARSTKCGQPKTPESRLSWFKRAGIVTITE